MTALRQRAWWILAAIGALLAVFGVVDVLSGAQADPGIALAISGQSLDGVRATDPVGFRLFDFATRALGLLLAVFGALVLVLAAGPYRLSGQWAWRALWLLPIWAIAVPLLYLGFGVAPGQPPAPPMVSGPIIAVLAAGALWLDRSRFGV